MTDDKYASLRQALDAAYEQAAEGKGKQRHARDGQDFTNQPIMAITRMVGLGYPCGQAMKKLQEAVGMAERGEHEAAQREMLGAINYAAAAWIRVGEMVGGDAGVSDDEPPVPWDKVHPDARFITRDADGSIDAWDGKNRPALWHNKLWDGEADEMMRLRWPDGDDHEPKIWERPAAREDEQLMTGEVRLDIERLREMCSSVEIDDQPPVPWDEVPDGFGWITRDGDGMIKAWTTVRPSLTTNAIWISGFGKCLRLRCPDDGEHEPKIWKRPTDD